MENQEESNGSGPSRRKLLELNTKGCCFLCFKPVNGNNENGAGSSRVERGDGERGEVYSLYQISRYLSLDMGQVLKRLTGPLLAAIPNEASLAMQKSEVMVTLCEGCGKAGARFRELFFRLDKIHLEMRYFLGKFQTAIVTSDEIPDLLGDFCERMTGDIGSMVHLGIVNELRREMLEKCTAAVSNSSPRIELKNGLFLNHVEGETKVRQQPLTAPAVTPSKSSVRKGDEIFCSTLRRSERFCKKEPCPLSPVPGPSHRVHTTITLDSNDSFQNDEVNLATPENSSIMQQGNEETTHFIEQQSTSTIAAIGVRSSSPSIIMITPSPPPPPPPASPALPVAENSEENPAMSNGVGATISPTTSSETGSLFQPIPTIKCRICKMPFATRGEIARHHKSAHPKTRYNCNQCERKFTKQHLYKQHIKKHVAETSSKKKTGLRRRRKSFRLTRPKVHKVYKIQKKRC